MTRTLDIHSPAHHDPNREESSVTGSRRTTRIGIIYRRSGPRYLRLGLRKKTGMMGILMVIMLVSQILASVVMADVHDDIPNNGFGIQQAMNTLIDDKDAHEHSLEGEIGDQMESYRLNATNQIIPESEVYADHTLPVMTEEFIDPVPDHVEIRSIEPVEPWYPRIFGLAESHTPVNETDSIMKTLIEGQDNYYIHTDHWTEDGTLISKWTQASFLPSLLDPDQGFKLNQWNGVNVDDDPTTGDDDKSLFEWLVGSFPEGSDIYVRVTATIPILDGLTGLNILTFINDLLNAINGSNLELTAGLKIEIRKDSYWTGRELPVDVGIVKAIGYQNLDTDGIAYLWVGDFNFSDVPRFFEFQVMLGTVSIHVGEVGNIPSFLMSFLLSLINPNPTNPSEYDFASFAPPYTVSFAMDRDGIDIDTDDDDSIGSFDFILGYVKVLRTGDMYQVVDRTYISAKMTPPSGTNVVPKQFHVKLAGKKNPLSRETDYDAVEWYSRRPVDVRVIYSEGKLNDTYVEVEVQQMPWGRLPSSRLPNPNDRTSLRVTLENLSTDEHDYTRIQYLATETIGRVDLGFYEYDRGYAPGNQYNCSTALIRDIPPEILLQGNFVLTNAKDPFSVFDNVTLSFINGMVDNAMLALASSLYAIGIKIRSIPGALTNAAGTQGELEVIMKDRTGVQAYLGMAELGVAYGHVSADPVTHARYAASTIDNHDYLMTYIDHDPRSGVEEKVAIGLRISGIGYVKYASIEDEEGEVTDITVELKTANTFDDAEPGSPPYAHDIFSGNMPKLEVFYLTGEGDRFAGRDYARIAISNLPDHITIRLQENITTFDATESRQGNRIIAHIAYESLIDGQYMEFNITHIPPYLRFVRNDTLLSVSTIRFPENAPPWELAKPVYYTRNEDHLNLAFFISNETRGGRVVRRSMPSNHLVIYRNQDMTTLNGSQGVASVSGQFNGLKSLSYTNHGDEVEIEIRIVNPDRENLAVRLIDDSRYDDDPSLGIRGSAIIGPIPEYLWVRSKRPETQKSVVEPSTGDVEGFEDIEILMDSVKAFGRSIVDVLLTALDDTLKGVGMAESTEFRFEFSLVDPILGTRNGLDIIADLKRGRVDDMYDAHPDYGEAYWTNGITLRQMILDRDEERAIFDLKVCFPGLPSSGSITMSSEGGHLQVDSTFSDVALDSDWIVFDVMGVGDLDVLIHATGIISPMDLTLFCDVLVNTTEDQVSANITASLKSGEVPVPSGSLYASLLNRGDDLTRLEMAVSGTPATVEISVELEGALSLSYRDNEKNGVDHALLHLAIGNTEEFEEPALWTHGISLRNGTDGNGDRIIDLKMYLEGIPDTAAVSMVRNGDDINADLSFSNWKPRTGWVLLDIRGLGASDILLYLDLDGTGSISMDMTLDIFLSTDIPEVEALVVFTANRDLGAMYLRFSGYGLSDPLLLQLYLPGVPRDIRTDLTIRNGISARFSSSADIEHLLVRVHRMMRGEWYHLTLMLHDIPQFLHVTLDPNTDFDPERSPILQGNPDITFLSSRDGLDVYLDVDGGLYGAYGHIHLQAGDLTNKTRFHLIEPDVYSLRSPGGVGFAFLVLSDLPIMNMVLLNELYIYVENARSVDIRVRQFFGLYPVFALSNTDGGRIHVKVDIEFGAEGKRIPVEAGILDVKRKRVPLLAPLFINDISTTLATDHYILPEPATTAVATILGLIRGRLP